MIEGETCGWDERLYNSVSVKKTAVKTVT